MDVDHFEDFSGMVAKGWPLFTKGVFACFLVMDTAKSML